MNKVRTWVTQKKLDYPEGSVLFDVRYIRSPEEAFEVVYWDPISNRLEVKYEKPVIEIWFLKPENRTNEYQIAQARLEDCYPIYCTPSKIPAVIAQEIGGPWMDIYQNMKDAYRFYEVKRKMCECPWVFKADFKEDVYFRLRWIDQYGRDYDTSKVKVAYLDIEVDTLDRSIEPRDYQNAPQPINAVSLILEEQKICALFVLGPRNPSQIDKRYHELLAKQTEEYNWLCNHQEEFKKRIIDEDKDNQKYLDGYTIRLHIFPFDEEIYMIKMIFEYINKYRPWFCLSWNAPFDDNYLMNRIKWLGYDPKEFFIPKEFKSKSLYFSEDSNPKAAIPDSKDFFYCSSYTQYLCQERLWGATRKSQQKPRSYSLNYVGKTTAGIVKLTDSKSDLFRKFAYTDFLLFLLYNVRDTVVQMAIEENCGDAKSFASRSYAFFTQFSKCFQETHIVRNSREYYFEKDGYTQACRLLVPEGVDTAYEGAFVADPALNNPTGLIINGKRTNKIMYGALDADAASYYPSTKMGENQDPMSLEYKCIIDNEMVWLNGSHKNKSFNQEYVWFDSDNNPHKKDLSGQIINSYKNGNVASTMYNWFNAPSMTDIFAYLDANL
jgi:hypothetical protein